MALTNGREPALEVGDDVVDILDAHRQAHRGLCNARGLERCFVGLGVRGGRRVHHQGAGIADIDGGREEAWAFIDALKLHSNLANIGDTRSLVVHPATTTHSQSDEAALKAAGITQATVRLSVGIEDVNDIIADLERGFAAIG